MPMYGFRCSRCGLEFEVSRSMKDAGNPAHCPLDNGSGSRIFTAPARVTAGGAEAPTPATQPAAPAAGSFSHFGHSHGFGAAGHRH